MNKATESAASENSYLRPGLTSITPYIVARGAAQLIEFLQAAFGAAEQLRMPAPYGSIMHAQVAIGNGAIELSDGGPPYAAAPGAIHLYVDDADAAFERALQSGATTIYPVAESPAGAVLHATIRIGNATLEVNEASEQFPPMPCHLHLYLPDTDATYADALQAGATSIEAPEDKPYGDRSAAVKDAWGNSWFLATYLAK